MQNQHRPDLTPKCSLAPLVLALALGGLASPLVAQARGGGGHTFSVPRSAPATSSWGVHSTYSVPSTHTNTPPPSTPTPTSNATSRPTDSTSAEQKGKVAKASVPPGFNVHFVCSYGWGKMWRGGAPTAQTLAWLGRHARQHNLTLTLIDLRAPASSDDVSGKGKRFTPTQEKLWARREHHAYYSMSALDAKLLPTLEQARRKGDVYIHCMYGVNRTGFAIGRFTVSTGAAIDKSGLGARDIKQGVDFQHAKGKH